MSKVHDEFEEHAREVLSESSPKLLIDLLALRRQARRVDVGAHPTADPLNSQNRRLFNQAAKLLGPAKFEAVFGFPLSEEIDLVDPMQMRNSGPRDAGPRSSRGSKIVAAPGKLKATKPVTTRDLAAALSEAHELTKKQGLELMGDLVAMITKRLKKGERVKIAGLGILQVRKRAARMGRNPATGEVIKLRASKKVAFRAAKDLKEVI